MFKAKCVVAAVVLSGFSACVFGDTWEPGLGLRFDFVPSHEVNGESENQVEGSQFGATVRYTTASKVPVTVGLSYHQGQADHSGDPRFADVSAKEKVVDLDLAIGRAFLGRGLEFVPYAGLGYRESRQRFSGGPFPENHDIATPKRTSRHLYVPLGLYLGGLSPIDGFDFYVSGEYRAVLMGDVVLSSGGGSTLSANNGHGARFEAGVHLPSSRRFNMVVGAFYETWTIDRPRPGVSAEDTEAKVERHPRVKTDVVGVTLGLQF